MWRKYVANQSNFCARFRPCLPTYVYLRKYVICRFHLLMQPSHHSCMHRIFILVIFISCYCRHAFVFRLTAISAFFIVLFLYLLFIYSFILRAVILTVLLQVVYNTYLTVLLNSLEITIISLDQQIIYGIWRLKSKFERIKLTVKIIERDVFKKFS